MSTFRSHLTVLESSAAKYSSSPAFRVPQIDSQTEQVQQWHTITYKQFLSDVERFARYWLRTLETDAVPKGSVVGLWQVSKSI